MKDTDLGIVMAVLRVAAGWTVDDLARATRLRSSTITDYEQGRIVPGINTVTRVSDALAYPFGALDMARVCIRLLLASREREDGVQEQAGGAMMKLRATPITMTLTESEEHDDSYPDGHWVYATTNLVFPSCVLYPGENLNDDPWCELRSPGDQAGGQTGVDEASVFASEAVVLTRMLSFMGVAIVDEKVARAGRTNADEEEHSE